jgi:cyanophycinase
VLPWNSTSAVLVSVLLVPATAQAEDISKVRGSLLFAGGELRFDNAPVWKRFIDLAGGKGARVVVVPAAARNPKKSGLAAVENLRRYGAEASVVPLAPRLQDTDYKTAAEDPLNVRRLREAKGIWFIGGDQRRITQVLLREDKERSKTEALKAIWAAYREGAVIGGSSAGTAIMSRLMFANAKDSLDTMKYGIKEGEVDTGLGFLGDEWFVDQHFLTRGRFARALKAMHHFRFKHGIGVDEDTAVVFKEGKFEVVGYKGALALDISHIEIDKDLREFNMKRAKLTYLDAGDCMNAQTGKVLVSKRKFRGLKIDPNDKKNFKPYYDQPEPLLNILGAWAIHEAMYHVLDSKAGEVKGVAFALRDTHDKKTLGFEFKLYRGADTIGWNTTEGGNDSYTVLNVYVDIAPVRLADPLYTPLKPTYPKSSKPARHQNGVP